MSRQEYIAQWNRLLTNYASTTLGIIAGRLCQPGIEVEWKERLEYLKLLLDAVIPKTLDRLGTAPRFTGIAGYSLAGLFALYALYRCDAFGRAASMSGSLWFPGFAEYVAEHGPVRLPDRVYLSLGDREAATRNPYLKTVADSTGTVADLFGKQGAEVIRETNPGNHFRDAALRSAKGIRALLI